MSISQQQKMPLETVSKATSLPEAKHAPDSNSPFSLELDFIRVSHNTEPNGAHVLFSPIHYEPGYSYPLLVWLHGPEQDERQIMRIMPMISMRNFVAVAPQGTFASSAGDSAGQIRATRKGLANKSPKYDWPQTPEGVCEAEQRIFDCISLAKSKCNIAPSQVYLAGFGTGGTMAFRIGMMFPGEFAGVISLCGGFPSGGNILGQWNAAKKLQSMLAFGTESEVFTSEMACENLKLFHTAGLTVSVRQYTCGQELSKEMLQDLNRWVMERVCNR